MKRPFWHMLTSHPVLGPIVTALSASILGIFVALVAGVSPSNNWLFFVGQVVPAVCVLWASYMALTRPPPKWRDGRWERR